MGAAIPAQDDSPIARKLAALRERAIHYFDEAIPIAPAREPNSARDDWQALPGELREAGDQICNGYMSLAGILGEAVAQSSLLTEADGHELGRALKAVGASLRFKHYRFWEMRELSDEDRLLAVRPARETEDAVSPEHAKELFSLSAERVERLAQLAGPLAAEREREQKFGILFSSRQAERDFLEWTRERDGSPVGVLFLDVDNFKDLNTKFSETRVDEDFMPELQHLLEEYTRHRGSAYRQGGDEFVILLPNQDDADALRFAERLINRVVAHRFSVSKAEVRVSISVGVATWPRNGRDYGAVLQAANDAEARAKREGRARVVVA